MAPRSGISEVPRLRAETQIAVFDFCRPVTVENKFGSGAGRPAGAQRFDGRIIASEIIQTALVLGAWPARSNRLTSLGDLADQCVNLAAATACWNSVCIAAEISPSVVTEKNIPGDAQLSMLGSIWL